MTTPPKPEPTPEPARDDDREEIHFRRVDMRAWQRKDGLYEVQGRVTDRKPFEFTSPSGGKLVAPHEPLHDMIVTLVYDADLVIHDVSYSTESAPHADCYDGGKALHTLKGLRIASGWSSEVKRRLAGARSCTHVMELLIPMATTAFQSLTKVRRQRPDVLDANGKPTKVDSCYAYAAEREIVMRRWPDYYTGPGRKGAKP